jgi:hypothetical protein
METHAALIIMRYGLVTRYQRPRIDLQKVTYLIVVYCIVWGRTVYFRRFGAAELVVDL